jgi:type IV secretion system protein VirB9
MKTLLIALLFSLPAAGALAADIPKPGKYDYRVKFVNYNPAEVVKLVAHFGYQVDIVLADGEKVLPKGIFLGDSEAWTFAVLNNHVLIKPKEENGRTNMTILTNKRHYSFDLSSHWSKKSRNDSEDMYFQVNFRYPQDEAAAAQAAVGRMAEAAAAAATQKQFDTKLAGQFETRNRNYEVQGSEDLAPDEATDDGRFTRLRFKGNRKIPAIFVVNEDGSESLANRHMDGDVAVIHTLARKFVLRLGNSVACVFNESYDPIGNSNDTGTTIPGVERVTKGEPQ